MKIGILTDSSSYITEQYAKENNIKVGSLKVIIDDQVFCELDGVTNNDVFKAMDEGKKVTTSQPSPDDFHRLYDEFKAEGYTDVIAIHISSNISGTIQSSKIAGDLVDDLNVHIFDTLSGGLEMELYIKKAVEMINANHTPEEIIHTLEKMRKYAKIRISIDDLMTLVRGGRLSAAQGRFGNLIGLKPILELDEEGRVQVLEKVRTKKRVYSYIINELTEDLKKHKELLVHITHVNSLDTAKELKEMIEQISNDLKVIICQEIGPGFAIHYGKGGFGVAWAPFNV